MRIIIIGNKIRKLRIAKNISQQVVADNLNIDRRTYAATAILILTDKASIDRVLDAIKYIDNKG
ncbi:hypothetical protein AGMMS50239_31380 [Bacteroidia bacterium]|nr:hypothetical protein AGMMS50239_31380 [Bacteroidia bacterium]